MESLKLLRLDDNTAVLGGYGVIFNTADLEGDVFTAETDYRLAKAVGADVYIDHTLDTYIEADGKTYKLKGIEDPIGEIIEIVPDDKGLYMELMIERTSQYWDMVEFMLHNGRYKAGLSTGSAPHLVRKEGGFIKKWPINEISLTLTPAEPKTTQHLTQLKAVAETDTPADESPEQPSETDSASVERVESEPTAKTIIELEEITMTVEETTNANPLEEQVKALSSKLDALMGHFEDSAKSARLRDIGYIAPDSETDRPQAKSFGDFLLAVKRGNYKRLATVYKVGPAVKDIDADGNAAVLVPDEYQNVLLQIQAEQSPIVSMVTRQPVNLPAGRYPALDQTIAPTAGGGDTALAAGITSATTAPGGSYTETQPSFYELNYQVNKVGGFVEVDNEIIADSAFAIETLLTNLFRINIAGKLEHYILRGSGVGEPLGILNAPVARAVSPATNSEFDYVDAVGMVAVFKSIVGKNTFIVHPSMWPDVATFEIGSNGAGVPQGVGGGNQLMMPGTPYGMVTSEHLPQANASGCVILADLGSYILFDRQQLQVAFSEHAAFASGKGTWRFDVRCDGKPWLKNAITLADPGGSYTVSPFVYFND